MESLPRTNMGADRFKSISGIHLILLYRELLHFHFYSLVACLMFEMYNVCSFRLSPFTWLRNHWRYRKAFKRTLHLWWLRRARRWATRSRGGRGGWA